MRYNVGSSYGKYTIKDNKTKKEVDIDIPNLTVEDTNDILQGLSSIIASIGCQLSLIVKNKK